jgi:hypothetical protein
MKYLKIFEEFNTDIKDIEKRVASGENLTLSDVMPGYDIYCGNHTNKDNDTEVCGYYFGEIEPSDDWSKKALGRRCPDCDMTIGNVALYVGKNDLNAYEEKLPGEGFYLFSKETEDKELLNDNPDNTKNSTTKSEENKLDPTKIYNHIEKYINVLVDTYLAISTQRYKATFTKDVIRKGLVRLQQECKFKDLSRAKEAIKVFNGSMKPMMDDVLNSKNIETWKLGANGKKYYSVFKDFTTMVNI